MSLNVLVCIKQVFVSNDLKIDSKTKNVIRSHEAGVMNPFDKNAIEAALKLKETYGGEITLLSMGPENFKLTLKEGLARGADKAYLLSSRAFGGAGILATGYVLASAIKRIGNQDLIFFGRKSFDADTEQVGPIVAEFLNLPQATYVNNIIPIDLTTIKDTRLMENSLQDIIIIMPAVITVRSELNNPRYITPRNIMLSEKKEIITWTEKDLTLSLDKIGIKGSKAIVREVFSP